MARGNLEPFACLVLHRSGYPARTRTKGSDLQSTEGSAVSRTETLPDGPAQVTRVPTIEGYAIHDNGYPVRGEPVEP